MKERTTDGSDALRRVVIVGAGIAGFTAARTLAALRNGIEIVLINGEDRIPYKRTKISKNMVRPFDRDAFALAQESWYRESGIRLLNGRQVSRLDTRAKSITLDTGEELSWDAAILATGSEPVHLEGEAFSGLPVLTVRRAADVEQMLRAVERAHDLLVIGGGVLGVEVSEQLTRMGRRVTFCIGAQRPMANQLNETASADLAGLLEMNGVELLLGRQITGLSLDREKIGAVIDSAKRRFDAVIACVGVRPSIELAVGAGLKVGRGILVDQYLETSEPGVFAAGDAAEHAKGFLSYLWHAAEYQGELAGRNAAAFLDLIPGQPKSIFDNPPFRLKCEVFDRYYFSAGVLPGVNLSRADAADAADAYQVVEERADGNRYRLFCYRDARLAGAIMINDHDRAKVYQKAVREGWTRGRVEEELRWN